MATDQIGQEMSEENIVSLLESEGHGVLSMGSENRGYGIPISYAYDAADERIVMEFVNVGESKKQAFVSEAAEVTLTVYNYEDRNTWESVVVTGTIHPVGPEEVSDRSAARFFAQADDAMGELRWLESDEIDRRWYEIRDVELSGRHGGTLPHKRPEGLVRFSESDRYY